MPAKRLSMRKIRDVLRLSWGCQQSQRQVALQCNISRPCVSEYLRRASDAGLCWPLPEELSDAQVDLLLFPPPPKLPAEQRGFSSRYRDLKTPLIPLPRFFNGLRSSGVSPGCKKYN